MITRIDNIKLTIEQAYCDENNSLMSICAKKLGCNADIFDSIEIIRKSLDARDKNNLRFVYSVAIRLETSGRLKKRLTPYHAHKYIYPRVAGVVSRPVIIGAGPAGLFCAYSLAKMGLKPIILERGKPVEDRQKDIEDFWQNCKLLSDSNVLFGEGGAGTFSDGKLNTLNKDINGRNTEVLRVFAELTGDISLKYLNKPHVGTDRLITFCRRMRDAIIDMGGEFHFSSKVNDITIENNKVISVSVNGEEFYSDVFILATGHSGRDTFELLLKNSVPMEPKAFAIGLRVAHRQAIINDNQYGTGDEVGMLPPASYKLTHKSSNGRGVYSFCMCPGGYIVNSSSEGGRLSINGMSYSDRGGEYANSAIIVTVDRNDYPNGCTSPLSGIELQRRLEALAYDKASGDIPFSTLGDYAKASGINTSVEDRSEDYKLNPESIFKGKARFTDISDILPKELSYSFLEGMSAFGNKIHGFDYSGTYVAGIESRTSSPVRIIRNSEGVSDICNLYPCGEGAGYAGGITSAAMDGLYIAECIAKKYSN